jgi:carboxypeptidase D
MKLSLQQLMLLSSVTQLTNAIPSTKDRRYIETSNGINYSVFEHAATSSKVSYVTNSGICETTPGVNQYSGYLSTGTDIPLTTINTALW